MLVDALMRGKPPKSLASRWDVAPAGADITIEDGPEHEVYAIRLAIFTDWMFGRTSAIRYAHRFARPGSPVRVRPWQRKRKAIRLVWGGESRGT